MRGDALLLQQHEHAQQNRSRRLSISDPTYGQQWHLHQSNGNDINVVPVWDAGYTGKGVVVTIVDDGMEHDHPDLEANYDASASTDLNGHDDDPYPNVNDPINKHGTRCSGEVGAVKNDVCGIGIAYKSSIGAVRMLDGDVTDAVEAGSLSLNPQHIDIYTNSWGPNDDGRTIEGQGGNAVCPALPCFSVSHQLRFCFLVFVFCFFPQLVLFAVGSKLPLPIYADA